MIELGEFRKQTAHLGDQVLIRAITPEAEPELELTLVTESTGYVNLHVQQVTYEPELVAPSPEPATTFPDPYRPVKLTLDDDEGEQATLTLTGGRELSLEWDPERQAYRAQENTYKVHRAGSFDPELVLIIYKLAELPGATFEAGQDDDGDVVWEVFLPVSALPAVTLPPAC